jgi:hypothetical protein
MTNLEVYLPSMEQERKVDQGKGRSFLVPLA